MSDKAPSDQPSSPNPQPVPLSDSQLDAIAGGVETRCTVCGNAPCTCTNKLAE